MLEAVLIDDEEKALESLKWELMNFSSELSVVAAFTDPFQALSYLDKNPPDCVFLDIEMPTMDGFQFIRKMQNPEIAVVITTAYNQYAIKALKNEAIDYLLKPIDTDDLNQTIAKIRKHLNRHLSAERLEKLLLQPPPRSALPSIRTENCSSWITRTSCTRNRTEITVRFSWKTGRKSY